MNKLSKLFGPGRDEIWQKLSNEIRADYVKKGIWSGSKVVARHENWLITLDVFFVSMGKAFIPFTRMRAPFQSTAGFRFAAYNQGFFHEIGKLFGMQDIESGDAEFDRHFILKGNDEEKVKRLFSSSEIRRKMLELEQIHLEVRDDEGWFGPDFPAETDELYFHTAGEIRDEARLKNLFLLFSDVLTELEKMGDANGTDAGIILK